MSQPSTGERVCCRCCYYCCYSQTTTGALDLLEDQYIKSAHSTNPNTQADTCTNTHMDFQSQSADLQITLNQMLGLWVFLLVAFGIAVVLSAVQMVIWRRKQLRGWVGRLTSSMNRRLTSSNNGRRVSAEAVAAVMEFLEDGDCVAEILDADMLMSPVPQKAGTSSRPTATTARAAKGVAQGAAATAAVDVTVDEDCVAEILDADVLVSPVPQKAAAPVGACGRQAGDPAADRTAAAATAVVVVGNVTMTEDSVAEINQLIGVAEIVTPPAGGKPVECKVPEVVAAAAGLECSPRAYDSPVLPGQMPNVL